MMKELASFVKERRKSVNLTQEEEFAERAGVALTVTRKMEQGKTNLKYGKGKPCFANVWTSISCC